MPDATIRIRRIPILAERLAALSGAERDFLFLSGHILNEINSLNKVFAWCLNSHSGDSETNIKSVANGVQSLIYARVLAGKLWEAWASLSPAWFGPKLSTSIAPLLHKDAAASLAALKKYFNNNSNSIYRVRNSFAFHYSASELGANWESATEGAHLEVLLGGTVGNNLNLAAELVANSAVFKAIDSTGPEAGLKTFFSDVQTVYSHFTNFFEGATVVLLEKALGGQLGDHGYEVNVAVGQSYSEVQLPYFCAPDRDSSSGP